MFDGKHKYVIPVYQRAYSCGEDQIKPFFQDILDGFLGKEKNLEELENLKDLSQSEPMFIGTMQLSAEKYVSANEVSQDVIDGQ